jgi:hypothetical protein
MIKLTDEYFIDADKYQFILLKMNMSKNKKTGVETPRWRAQGYYPTLATLIRGLSDRFLYAACANCESLKSVQEDLIKWAEHLKTPLVAELKAAVKQYEASE